MTEPLQIHQPRSGSEGHSDIFDCVQCGYCSAYCKVSFISEDSPRKVIRFLQQDDIDKAVKSSFVTLCKQCQTCTWMCPQGIDVAGIMRHLVRHHFINY